jgi:hypothetical protein
MYRFILYSGKYGNLNVTADVCECCMFYIATDFCNWTVSRVIN